MSAGDRIEGAPLFPWLEWEYGSVCFPDPSSPSEVGDYSLHPVGMTLAQAMFMFWVVKKWKLSVTGNINYYDENDDPQTRSIAHTHEKTVEFFEFVSSVYTPTAVDSEKDLLCNNLGTEGKERLAHPYMSDSPGGLSFSLAAGLTWDHGNTPPVLFDEISGLYYPHLIVQVQGEGALGGVIDYNTTTSNYSGRSRTGSLQFGGHSFVLNMGLDITDETSNEWNWDGTVTLEAVEYWPHSTRDGNHRIWNTTTGVQDRHEVTGALL